MNPLAKKLAAWPSVVQAAPYLLFVTLTALQGEWGEASRYWIYAAKTFVGVGLVLAMRPLVSEMRWVFSWEAVVVGVGVCVLWVGLDGFYPSLDQVIQIYACPVMKQIGLGRWCHESAERLPWNPHAQFGQGSGLARFFIAVRFFGPSIIVPPLEEVFYRSFLYRYIIKADFQAVPLGFFNAFAFVTTAVIFGFSHFEWLAGILCAFAYQGLVLKKRRLGDAMTAHAITNFLLGVWVVWKGAWHFW